MVKLGLRSANWPNEEEKVVLISHIVSNYGNHTVKEVLLAFEMAIAGKLGVDPTTYENFSCLYFSEIMNAYREWAKVAYKVNIKEIPMIEQKEDLGEMAMQAWYDDVKQRVIAGMDYHLIPLMLYDFLDKKGLIKLTTPEKFKYMDAAARKIEAAGDPPEMEKVKSLAKRMVVNDYILSHA